MKILLIILKKTIELIKENVYQLENGKNQFHPLEIDQSFISIPSSTIEQINFPPFLFLKNQNENQSIYYSEEVYEYHFSLSRRNSFYPYLISPKQKINLSCDNWYTLSTNDHHLLTIEKSHIYLFNRDFKILNQKFFINLGIKDICWSKTLNRFI